MFHDDAFLKKIDEAQRSRHVALEAGHWIQHEQTAEVLYQMKSFFDETKQK